MSRWTVPRNLREHDRIQTQDGSTVTVSGTETGFLSARGKNVSATTVTGRREGSNEEYRAVVPEGQRVKKII